MRHLGFCMLIGGFIWWLCLGLLTQLRAYGFMREHGAGTLEVLSVAPERTTFTRQEVEQITEQLSERIHRGSPEPRPLLTMLVGGFILAYAKRRRVPTFDEEWEAHRRDDGARGPRSLARFLGWPRKMPPPNPALERTPTAGNADSASDTHTPQ